MPAARTSPAHEGTGGTAAPAGPAVDGPPPGTDGPDAVTTAPTAGDHPSGWPTGRLLSTAARLVEQRWNEALARFDLTHAGFGVVAHLMAGPLSQHQVAGLTKVEDQTISRTLDKLERQGHVRRELDATDRRRRVVTVTPEGRRAFAAIAASGMDLEMVDDRVAEHCDLDDFRAALVALLEPGTDAP
ncbi:MarR family winged helix-turn-helix transcriptional regulator [Aquipuribacter hungaricus]|uniref:MarR family winged helix-turn-helix transcriptional regulator n=1 Tax=Aquipuribacter hungaricus TaxID=545624 RepID=A0ABV7WGM6_9MICO